MGSPRLPGIIKTKGEGVDHVVSVVGWGTDSKVPSTRTLGNQYPDVPGLVNVYITDGKITMLLRGKSTRNGRFVFDFSRFFAGKRYAEKKSATHAFGQRKFFFFFIFYFSRFFAGKRYAEKTSATHTCVRAEKEKKHFFEHLDYFPYFGNFIIPTDFNSIIFQRARAKNHHQPVTVIVMGNISFCGPEIEIWGSIHH